MDANEYNYKECVILQRKIDALHDLVDAVDLQDAHENGKFRKEPDGFAKTKQIREIFGWLPNDKAMGIIEEKKGEKK